MVIDKEVRSIAVSLCTQDRYSSRETVEVSDGFSVPLWLIYVSRAQQLISERVALTGK